MWDTPQSLTSGIFTTYWLIWLGPAPRSTKITSALHITWPLCYTDQPAPWSSPGVAFPASWGCSNPKSQAAAARLALNVRVGEINMVNPREVVGIYTQCAGKSGYATASGLQLPGDCGGLLWNAPIWSISRSLKFWVTLWTVGNHMGTILLSPCHAAGAFHHSLSHQNSSGGMWSAQVATHCLPLSFIGFIWKCHNL
jgi:hypothetical protein